MMKIKSRRLPFYKDDHPHLIAQVKSTTKNMKEGVKPYQPVQLSRSRWVLGDVTEVLDHNSWRLGKITEVLNNDYFVIRLVGFIQPREFHISSLRIPHTYDSKNLTVADRVSELSKLAIEQDPRAYEEDDQNTRRKVANVYAAASARTAKRKLEASTMPPNHLVRRTGKKQKGAAYEVRQAFK
ncbi:unnamed protein product [Urochloa humidicola]